MAKKAKTVETTTQSARYVFDDIILEILYRLPTRSLLRFTSVSKSWKASIRSSNFISAHHQINEKISCSHLVYLQQRGEKYCKLIPESIDEVSTPNIPAPPITNPVSLVGSSEGLVCLITCTDIYLWNPFIRTTKQINLGQFPELHERLAFGFAPQSCDYKIVTLSVQGGYLTGAEIYSLSSDSWTRMKSPSGRLERNKICYLGSKISFKGCIYWLVYLYSSARLILKIDLDKQKIEEMEIDTLIINSKTRFTVFHGFLGLLRLEHRGNQTIPVQSYIYKESKSGSLSWTTIKIVDHPIEKSDWVGPTTTDGHIIIQRSPLHKIFACDYRYDGKDLSFRLRDLIITDTSGYLDVIATIKETLHLLDGERYGQHSTLT